MGIDTYGNVWTWGSLGNSDGTPLMQPGLVNVTTISAGYDYGLAIDSVGTLWGWGNGDSGQLGNGSYAYESVPTPFDNVQNAVAIAAGSPVDPTNHETSLVVKTDGELSGFGDCYQGQLGANLGIYNYLPKPLFGIAMTETPPTVSIASPSCGTIIPLGTTLQLQASATSSSGFITTIEYYLEGVKIGTATNGSSISYVPPSSGSYTFEAVCYDNAGVGSISSPLTIAVSAPQSTVMAVANGLAAPTDLAVTPSVAGALAVSWTNNATSATSIAIQVSTDGSTWTTEATLDDPTATDYTIAGLIPGQDYNVRVIAQNNNGLMERLNKVPPPVAVSQLLLLEPNMPSSI